MARGRGKKESRNRTIRRSRPSPRLSSRSGILFRPVLLRSFRIHLFPQGSAYGFLAQAVILQGGGDGTEVPVSEPGKAGLPPAGSVQDGAHDILGLGRREQDGSGAGVENALPALPRLSVQ